MAPVLDASVYARMREKMRWSETQFYVGHLTLHVFPLMCALMFYERPQLQHGIVAAALHGFWFLSTDMDKAYVPMKKEEWHTLILIAFTAEILCCASAEQNWVAEA